jgi:hypothetical protein
MAGTGTTLSEAASKALLREFGVPIADERDVKTALMRCSPRASSATPSS